MKNILIIIVYICAIALMSCIHKDKTKTNSNISYDRVINDSLILKYPLKIDSICHYNIIVNTDVELFKKKISIIYDTVNDSLDIKRSLNLYYFCIYLNSNLEIIKIFVPDYNSMDKSKVNAMIVEFEKMNFKILNEKNLCDIYSFDIFIHLQDLNHKKIVDSIFFARDKEDYIYKKSNILKCLGGVSADSTKDVFQKK